MRVMSLGNQVVHTAIRSDDAEQLPVRMVPVSVAS
jgi:hypothetical protein